MSTASRKRTATGTDSTTTTTEDSSAANKAVKRTEAIKDGELFDWSPSRGDNLYTLAEFESAVDKHQVDYCISKNIIYPLVPVLSDASGKQAKIVHCIVSDVTGNLKYFPKGEFNQTYKFSVNVDADTFRFLNKLQTSIFDFIEGHYECLYEKKESDKLSKLEPEKRRMLIENVMEKNYAWKDTAQKTEKNDKSKVIDGQFWPAKLNLKVSGVKNINKVDYPVGVKIYEGLDENGNKVPGMGKLVFDLPGDKATPEEVAEFVKRFPTTSSVEELCRRRKLDVVLQFIGFPKTTKCASFRISTIRLGEKTGSTYSENTDFFAKADAMRLAKESVAAPAAAESVAPAASTEST